MDTVGQNPPESLAPQDADGHQGALVPVAFINGAATDKRLLRYQIIAPVKAALAPPITWRDCEPQDAPDSAAVRVSLFPNVPGNVLLMFDLADRNHFRQFSDTGRPYVQDFRKVLVPGNWLRRQMLADTDLRLQESQVVSAGSPRIDHLRSLMAAQGPRAADAPLQVLFVPMHDNWSDSTGKPMSMRDAMAPHLDVLRAHCDVTEVVDARNKAGKLPVTAELLAADMVITDYTSVMYEAWALGKPVLFLRWLTGDRILRKAPRCAEAHVYRNRIGHHVDSFDDLIPLLKQGRALGLGPGVDAFMADYLDNWRGTSSARAVARILARQADPAMEQREHQENQALTLAINSNDWASAEALLIDILRWRTDEAMLFDMYARAMNGQGKWWQELDALEQATALAPDDASLCVRLGDVRMRMGRCRAAADAFAEAIRLGQECGTADLLYKLGVACETAGHDGPPELLRAQSAYAAACALNPQGAAGQFGVGALHAAAGKWNMAAAAYVARLTNDPMNAELHQRLGMAHDRNYAWGAAETAYLHALALKPTIAAWHARLGFVLERQERFETAAAAYLHAAKMNKKHEPDWFYRAGFVLEKAGKLQQACEAYVQVVAKAVAPPPIDPYLAQLRNLRQDLLRQQTESNPEDAELWLLYGKVAEETGDLATAAHAVAEGIARSPVLTNADIARQSALDTKQRKLRMIESRLNNDCSRAENWMLYGGVLADSGQVSAAIAALQQAALRSNDHLPACHHQLGMLLMKQGLLAEACTAFRDQSLMQRPHGVAATKAAPDSAALETEIYREFHDVLPLMPQTILYEAFGGEGCADNPLAIFNHVQNDPRFAGWKHFWVLEDLARAPAHLLARQDVFFVQKETLLYQRLLCTVEYLINNATFPSNFVRKAGQHYLNTWHGTPLKTLGYDIEATPVQRANTARNLMQATMFIAPNAHTEHVMLNRYGVGNLFSGQSLQTGYPRIDMLINADDAEKNRIRNLLGLDPTKPVVLFAPTYRGHWATPELEAQSLADTLHRMKSDDYNLVFRGHYFAERFILDMDLPVTIAPHAIDTCSLLSIVDVLVSDYSSIFYDFLVTRRPVIHFVPDWDYYVETRGVYFGKDQLPGIICDTEEQLLVSLADCIRDPKSQISKQYLRNEALYCALEDGKASERVINAFFFAPKAPAQRAQPKGAVHMLIHGGDLQSGAQLSALQGLLAEVKAQGHTATLVVDRRMIINDAARIANAQHLLDRTDVIIRFGKTCFTPEEAWINSQITQANYQAVPEMRAIFDASIRHETRRLFGDATFDVVLELDAHRPFWGNVLSAIPARNHIIRLPADIMAEARRASPGLERVVNLLPRFDRVLSETDALSASNTAALKTDALDSSRFAVLPVCVSPDDIAARLQVLPTGAAGQTFVAHQGLRLLGVPGTDLVAAGAMLTALAEVTAIGETAQLGLVCAPEAQPALYRMTVAAQLADRVSLLPDTQDLLPLLNGAALVLIAKGAEFGAHIAADAQLVGTPVLPLDAKAAGLTGQDLIRAAKSFSGRPNLRKAKADLTALTKIPAAAIH